MINVRKGIAHGLNQSDRVATPKSGEDIIAGMIVSINSDGEVIKGSADASTALLGFAINNQADGDVLASGKLAFYTLDGNSVIETDQTAATVNTTNYPIGTPLAIDGVTGKVKVWPSNPGTARIIGTVYDVRSLPSVTVPGTYPTRLPDWQNTAVLAIKLAV